MSEPSGDEADLSLLSPEERDQRRKFEQKRKAHYNEFYALKMARQLIAQEEEEEEDGQRYRVTISGFYETSVFPFPSNLSLWNRGAFYSGGGSSTSKCVFPP